MRLAINAGVINKKRNSGVGIFAINICKAILRNHHSTQVWTTKNRYLTTDNATTIKHFHPIYRAIWDQVCFPRIIKKNADVAFFPIQEGMLRPPIPQVLFLHDIVAVRWPQYHPFLRVLSFKTRVRTAIKNSSAILVPSDSVKKEALNFYKIRGFSRKIHIIHEGYDEKNFCISNVKNSVLKRYNLVRNCYFLYIGRIVPTKNIHNIIKAFFLFKKKNKDSRIILALAGEKCDSKYYSTLNKQIQRYGILNQVIFLDYVYYDELPTLYNNAIGFIFPSYYEGFGLPILEAMACGCPVITSNTYSMPEVAGNAGLLVDPHNYIDISQNMSLLYNDLKFRNKLIQLAFNNILRFSWDNSAKKIVSICKRLAADS